MGNSKLFQIKRTQNSLQYKVCKASFSILKINLLNALLMVPLNGPSFDESNYVILEPTETNCPKDTKYMGHLK